MGGRERRRFAHRRRTFTASVRGSCSRTTEVPPDLRGINDETNFRALVSCLVSEKKNGKKISTVNVTTAPFPATPTGDSDIDAQLQLPGDCVAPIIFIMSGEEDHWLP